MSSFCGLCVVAFKSLRSVGVSVLRSKIGHNEISPKTKEQVKPKRKNLRLSPKVIGTDDPWETKGRLRGS